MFHTKMQVRSKQYCYLCRQTNHHCNGTMKKNISSLLLCIIAMLAITTSCTKESVKKSVDIDYDERLLHGTWYCSSLGLFYEFSDAHAGKFYDSNGDGKSYEWTLNKDVLKLQVKGEGVNVTVFETYIITSLNALVMKCHDELEPSEILIFNKQP